MCAPTHLREREGTNREYGGNAAGASADILNVVPEGVLTSTGICDALNHRFGTAAKCDLVRAQAAALQAKTWRNVAGAGSGCLSICEYCI